MDRPSLSRRKDQLLTGAAFAVVLAIVFGFGTNNWRDGGMERHDSGQQTAWVLRTAETR